MILNFNSGCIACGRATKSGGELIFIGDRATPKYKFSIQVENEQDDEGKWYSKFLDCKFFGKAAESAPEIHSGDLLFCAGKLETREWTSRDGEPRTSTTLKCDFATVSTGSISKTVGAVADVYPPQSEFAEIGEEDGELPF